MRATLTLFTMFVCGALGLGCASGGVSSQEKCATPASDSVYRAFAPVYRACAVERTAKAESQKFPQWTPPSRGQSCYAADLEYVVDTTGEITPASARVIRTNSQDFADVFVANLPTWRYDAAVLGGAKVRQIVTMPVRVQGVTVVVARGSGPPPVPAFPHIMSSC